MTKNQILLLTTCCIVFFALGFWVKSLNSKEKSTVIAAEQTDEKTSQSSGPANKLKQADTETEDINYSKLLKGKFILKGADYAGFEFMKGNLATWTNELFPNDPDTMRINWINNNTFVATFISDLSEDCPPHLWIKQVVSLEGKKLKLIEINASWVDYKEKVLTFVKE
jgi:hypothetical protein